EAAGHAGREVPARLADDHHAAARHVLAAVVADALHDGMRAAVADGKTLAGHAAHVGLAAGRAVKRDVADDAVVLGHEPGTARGVHDEPTAGEALAPVVVGVTFQRERDPARQER